MFAETLCLFFSVRLKSHCLQSRKRIGMSRKCNATGNYYQPLHP